VKSSKPILMLHSTLATHRSWDVLAEKLWSHGFDSLYALDIPDIFVPNNLYTQLSASIAYLLENLHINAGSVVVIGHGSGGGIAYRYWQSQGDAARISYLFMIGTPHNQTIFTMLRDHFMEANTGKKTNIQATQTISMNFNRIVSVQPPSSTILVNILGNLPGQDLFDGVVRGLRLPEAASEIIPRDHRGLHQQLNKDPEVIRTILSYLRGERYLVKLRLVGLRMQREDSRLTSGPVAFEIDGKLMPPDVFFQAITDRLYLFEDRVPALCTLAYPTSKVSTAITIHLKDLSNVQGRRRRMYTRLHIPLHDNESSAHAMQDSEGSDFLWRIACKQTPSILEDPPSSQFHNDLSRTV
jgi:pimeloyl-ACP methyl ester carboxylesterase